MQEHVRDKLPQCKLTHDLPWAQVEGIEKSAISAVNGEEKDQKERNIGDEEPLHSGRKKVGAAAEVSSVTECHKAARFSFLRIAKGVV
jgi:hypothetical protein